MSGIHFIHAVRAAPSLDERRALAITSFFPFVAEVESEMHADARRSSEEPTSRICAWPSAKSQTLVIEDESMTRHIVRWYRLANDRAP